MSKDIYESPLSSRYASPYMLHLFSPDMRFQTWRRLWVELILNPGCDLKSSQTAVGLAERFPFV